MTPAATAARHGRSSRACHGHRHSHKASRRTWRSVFPPGHTHRHVHKTSSPPLPPAPHRHNNTPKMVLRRPAHRHSAHHRTCQSRILCPCRLRMLRPMAPRPVAPAGAAAVLPALRAEPDGLASESALPLYHPASLQPFAQATGLTLWDLCSVERKRKITTPSSRMGCMHVY